MLDSKGKGHVQLLGYHGDTSRHATASPRAQVASFQENLPLLGLQDTAEQAQQGRLAGTVWSQQAHHLATPHAQSKRVEERLLLIAK